MKISLYKLMVVVMIIAGACTSGKDSPADSHPGSGSVKQNSDAKGQKDSRSADTAGKDSMGRR